MTIINTNEYRMAFSEYLRKGTPIRLATKQTHPTTHYVWRTLGDNKVRSSHQANEGQVSRLSSWCGRSAWARRS